MPPAIIVAAIAIGASAAAAAAWISITTALVIVMAASVAGALLTKSSVPGLGNYKQQSERKQVLRSSAAPQQYIYGKTVVSGLLFFAEEQAGDQTEGEWLHLAIAIAGHPIDHLGNIWLGDDLVSTYGNNVSWTLHNNRTTPDPYMIQHCPSWKSDMIGRGIAWLRMSLKFDAEKFPSGLPNVTMEVYGKKVYDPRNGLTQWSDNAALCILDYYKSVLEVNNTDIIMSDFITAANLCDEQTQIEGGGNEQRYRLNGAFDLNEARSTTLDDMHEACAGEATYIGGQHGLLVGAYYGPATMHLTDSQIIDNIKIVPETSWKDKVNIISGTFIDPNQRYIETDFPEVRVNAWVAEDGAEFNQDKKYRFVVSVYQAQRLAQIVLNRSRLGRTIELALNFAGYQYRPGYYILLTINSLGIINQEFRVTKWELNPAGGCTITVRQETAAVWGDAIGVPIDRPDLTNLPGPTVGTPNNIAFTPVASDAVLNYQGELSWVNPTLVDFTQVIIQGAGKTVVSQNSRTNRIQVNGLDKGVTYTAYLRNSAKGGILSGIGSLQFTLALDSKYYGDIYANNGYFKGTIYANNIVGDIYNKASGGISVVNPTDSNPPGATFRWASSAGTHILWNMAGEEFDRWLDSNMTLVLESSNRQYFSVYTRTPGHADILLAQFDTGNEGSNSPARFRLEGLTLPASSRESYNQIIVVVGQNRSSSAYLQTPLSIQELKTTVSPVSIKYSAQREAPWVSVYKKGRTPATSVDI